MFHRYADRGTKMSHPYTREYFDEGTIGYKLYRDFPSHWRIVKIILEKKPESVLDVGGARGYIVKKLEANGIHATCMDIAENAYHNRVTENFMLHDARVTPWIFSDKTFDLCMSTSFMEHLTEPEIEVVIKEMARVSKRGYHSITFEKTPQDIDITHRTFKPIEWWYQKFKEYAPDYPVEIMTKQQTEELEKTPIELPKADNLVKLNIGCFTDMFHYGWKNIDAINLTEWAKIMGYDFIHADVREGIKMADNSVDIILASHFLEHLTREEGVKFLAECYRVLKPNGLLRLAVPDAKFLAEEYVDDEIMEFRHINIGVEKASDSAEAFYHLLLAGHKTIYDYESLKKALLEWKVKTCSPFESSSKALKLQTFSMYPTLSLYVEAKKRKDMIKHDRFMVSENINPKPASTHVEPPSKVPEITKNVADYKKLKIALFSTPLLTVPPVNYGGLEMIVADLGRELASLGHDVTIFAPKGSKVDGCRIFEIGNPALTVFVDWLQLETQMFETAKAELMTGGYDIIHGNNWFGMEYRAKALDPKLHVLHTHHGGLVADWWTKTKAPFKLNMVGISEWMKTVYERQGMPTRAVYNGVNPDKYPLQVKKSDRFLFLSRIAFFKAPHTAIQIAKDLGLKLDVAGATQFVEDSKYVEAIKKSCDGTQIRWIGEVTHEQKLELMRNAKALIVPALWGEPFGLHVVESMMVGTPVYAVADGGIKETVKQGGVLCQDADALKEALSDFKHITPTTCRKNAMLFSTKNMALSYLKAYSDVIAGNEW